MMNCAKCGAENREGRKFCAKCAAPLARLCPQCGASNEPGENFCGECAAALGQAPAASPKKANDAPIRVADSPVSENLEGERKTVTALFADIKGSTELEQDLDPEEARAIVDPALKLMIDAVRRYDGYVVQSTGDGIFALFGAPVAHEDHPQRALYAALRMQDELKRYSTRLREAGNLPLEARVGVNTGEVVVRPITTGEGHTEYTPIGHTTNLAARMQVLAPTGSIAISEQTRKFAEGYFELKPLGPTRVKGVSDPVNVFEVAGLGPLRTRLQRSAGRGLTKFVGREREMEAMRNAAELARAGRGQIVAAIAEAGTGKSRLFFEFKARNQSGWAVLDAFSVSHGKASAYLPLLDLLHSYFEIKPEDDARKRREKVIGKVLSLDRSLEDALPYLFALLSIVEGDDSLAQMDAQIKKRRTLDAIKRIFLRESLSEPLMVIFEDLHWIDEGTQEFLNLLADAIGTSRILLLVNYRPEYSHQWISKTYYTQLRLDPLGKESADEMLSALIGNRAELAPLKMLITEKTEGNPFFMEETVQVLLDEGALVRDGATVRLTKPIGTLKIPPTVQGILAARIDRLPADAKDLLQTLAVIGRQFPLSLISATVAKPRDDLDRMLNDLQIGEFIYEQPAVGDAEYVFKHALTQEVAHNSVLMERRKQLHERIGLAVESLYAASIDDHVAELAHHFSQTANVPKALEFLQRAGAQAIQRASFSKSESYFSSALDLVVAMPESPERDALELKVRSALAETMMISRGFAALETLDMASRARALAEKLGDLPELVRQLWNVTAFPEVRGELAAAAALADKLLEVARREGSASAMGMAHDYQLELRYIRGDLRGSEEYFQQGLEYFEAPEFAPVQLGISIAFANASFVAWMSGRADSARERMSRVLAQGEQNPLDGTYSHTMCAVLHVHLREMAQAEDLASRASAEAAKHGILNFANWAQVPLGLARAALGHPAEGVALIRNAVSHMKESGARLTITHSLTFLAWAQALDGNVADALESIDEALTANPEEKYWLPETYRIRGELRLMQSDRPAAEADFHEALSLSRTMGAKIFELRATMSLARLLAEQGKRDEARASLAEIYNWFTEGFDTADLKDAKALLDELSG